MQGNFGKAAENQGYFIPPSIIKHVLNDIKDGTYSKELTVSISGEKKLKNPSLARDQTFGELPDYYIYGGVVFVPLNMNLIKRWGSKWRQKAPLDFLMNRDQPVSKERQEIVVALQVLPAEVNIGYHDWSTDCIY